MHDGKNAPKLPVKRDITLFLFDIRYLESTLKSFQEKLVEVSALTSILQLHPDEGDSSLGRGGPQDLPKQQAENLSDSVSARGRVVHNHDGTALDQSTARINFSMKDPKNINLAACREDPIEETLPAGAGDDVTASASCGDGGEIGAPRGPATAPVFALHGGGDEAEGSTTCSQEPKFRLRQQVYALEKMKWKCDGTQQSLHSKYPSKKKIRTSRAFSVLAEKR